MCIQRTQTQSTKCNENIWKRWEQVEVDKPTPADVSTNVFPLTNMGLAPQTGAHTHACKDVWEYENWRQKRIQIK